MIDDEDDEADKNSVDKNAPKISRSMDLDDFKKACKYYFRKADGDGDGQIKFLQFRKLYMRVHINTPYKDA